MPASGEALQHEDLITRDMCVQMTDWIFHLINLKHPHGDDFYASSYLLTAYLFAQRASPLIA